jgi:hypothetical protein
LQVGRSSISEVFAALFSNDALLPRGIIGRDSDTCLFSECSTFGFRVDILVVFSLTVDVAFVLNNIARADLLAKAFNTLSANLGST